MLFVLRGSVLPEIALQLVITAAFAVLVTLCHGQLLQWKIQLNFVPFSLIGLTLAIFLGFRNSTSYARYWEARTLWGVFLNETRSLVRQALTHVDEPAHTRKLAMYLVAFVHAARHQLRGSDSAPDLQRLLAAEDCAALSGLRYKPVGLLMRVGHWVRERRQEGSLSPVLVPAMEASMCRLSDALGGLRAHCQHADSVHVCGVDSPHGVYLLPAAAVWAGGHHRRHDARHRHFYCLHLLRARSCSRRD